MSTSKHSTPESMKFLGGNTGAINKNLLTPCRRVGLSRKSKTPLLNLKCNSALGSNVEDLTSSAKEKSSPLAEKLPSTPKGLTESTALVTSSTTPVNRTKNYRRSATSNKADKKVVKSLQNETKSLDNDKTTNLIQDIQQKCSNNEDSLKSKDLTAQPLSKERETTVSTTSTSNEIDNTTENQKHFKKSSVLTKRNKKSALKDDDKNFEEQGNKIDIQTDIKKEKSTLERDKSKKIKAVISDSDSDVKIKTTKTPPKRTTKQEKTAHIKEENVNLDRCKSKKRKAKILSDSDSDVEINITKTPPKRTSLTFKESTKEQEKTAHIKEENVNLDRCKSKKRKAKISESDSDVEMTSTNTSPKRTLLTSTESTTKQEKSDEDISTSTLKDKKNLFIKQAHILLERCEEYVNISDNLKTKDDQDQMKAICEESLTTENQVTASYIKTNNQNKCTNKPKKSVRKCLSLKSNTTCSQEETDFDDVFSITKVNSKTNSPANMSTTNIDYSIMENQENYESVGNLMVNFDNVQSNIPVQHNIGISDEDFQISQRTVTELMDDIQLVKKRIQEKETEVSKLKQAAIYKNRHKIDELKALTMVWKLGCKRALEDLHMMLNINQITNQSIEMPALLQKLNIPNEVFTCTPNGTII